MAPGALWRCLEAILWAAVLAATFLAAGGRARRVARLPLPPGLRLPVDFLLGSWVAAALALGCGLLGGFRPGALIAGVALLAAAGRWRGDGYRWRPVLAALPATIVLLPVALAPPFFYDALVYHLALPWQALHEGRIAPHPENLFTAFPPLAQLIAAIPLSAGLDRVPALLHLASFAAAGAALVALARGLGAPPALALLAGATLPLLRALVLIPGMPAAEGWAIAAVIAALVLALAGRERSGRAALAGFLAGAACAARLQGLPWSAIVIVVLALRASRPGRMLLASSAGWSLGSAPWWIKNLVLLRDPFAPLGWSREGTETLWRDAGRVLRMGGGAAAIGRGLAAGLRPHLYEIALLAIAGAVALVASRRGGDDAPGSRRAPMLAGSILAGLLAWGMSGTLPRFLGPALGCLLALAAAAGRARLGLFIGSFALAASALLSLAVSLRAVRGLGGPSLLMDDKAAERLIVNNPLPAFRSAASLPPEAKVLFVGEARGFPFPRRFVAPSQHDVSPLRRAIEDLPSPRGVRDRLAAQGYTHMLVNRTELARLAPRYPVLPWKDAAGQRRFQEFLDFLGPPVIAAGEVAVFRLGSSGQ